MLRNKVRHMTGVSTRDMPMIILGRVDRKRTLRNGISMIRYDKKAGINESKIRIDVSSELFGSREFGRNASAAIETPIQCQR